MVLFVPKSRNSLKMWSKIRFYPEGPEGTIIYFTIDFQWLLLAGQQPEAVVLKNKQIIPL